MAIEPDNRPWIPAKWDVPPWIRAGITTRLGGASRPPFNSLNLATHVGDDPETVTANRAYLSRLLNLPSEPVWLNQLHGNRIIDGDLDKNTDADGIFTVKSGVICAIMTADCVPLLFCNHQGTKIAAIHVGWRGYCADIISNALSLFAEDLKSISVWIGPHIGKKNYEVGDDVRDSCIGKDINLKTAFSKNLKGRWQADLEMLVRYDLGLHAVSRIFSTDLCTYERSADFFSYRRDKHTGRMASMIWIDK